MNNDTRADDTHGMRSHEMCQSRGPLGGTQETQSPVAVAEPTTMHWQYHCSVEWDTNVSE